MIKATFYIKDDFIEKIDIKGHAGYAEYGEDIVCAGVSTLAVSVINTLKEYVKAGIEYSVDEAYVSLKIIEIDEKQKIQVDTLTKMLMIAVEGMSKEYKEYVEIEVKEK